MKKIILLGLLILLNFNSEIILAQSTFYFDPLYEDQGCGLNYVQDTKCVHERWHTLNTWCNPFTSPVEMVTPFTGNVRKAYVFFTMAGPSTYPPIINITISNTNGTYTGIPAQLKDLDAQNATCWSYSATIGWIGTATYIADVTPYVISGSNFISGLPRSDVDPNMDTDGVTLFVVYNTPCSSGNTKWGYVKLETGLVIREFVDPATVPLSYATPFNNNPTTADAFMIVGDAELVQESQCGINGPVTFSGEMYNFVTRPNGFVSAPVQFMINKSSVSGDCVNLSVVGVYYQDERSECEPISISATSTDEICDQHNGSILITAQNGAPPYDFEWTPSVSTTASAYYLSAGTYHVVVTDANSCSEEMDILISSTSGPGQLLGSDIIECYDNSVTLVAAGSHSDTYEWTIPPPFTTNNSTNTLNAFTSGTYSVTVTNANGCSMTDEIEVTFANMPSSLNIYCTNPVICPGEEVTMSTIYDPDYSYLWSPGNETTSGITVTPVNSTTYSVVATDQYGCTASGSQEITIVNECVQKNYCFLIKNEDLKDAGNFIMHDDDDVVVGGMMRNTIDNEDFYIAKLNEYLVNEFSERGGVATSFPISMDNAYSIIKKDGYYYIAGTTALTPDDHDVIVAKFDEITGQIIWVNRYGRVNFDDVGIKILDYDDDNLIVFGHTNSITVTNYDIFAMKIEKLNGLNPFIRLYSIDGAQADETFADAIKVRNENKFVLCGTYSKEGSDMIALKIDMDLLPVGSNWTVINGTGEDISYGLTQRIDINNQQDHIYWLGKTSSYGEGPENIYIVELKTSNLTTTGKNRIFGLRETISTGYKIITSFDNNLVIVGDLHLDPNSSLKQKYDAFVSKIFCDPLDDPNIYPDHLTQLWTKVTYQNYNHSFYNLEEFNSESLLITGRYGLNKSDEDIIIVRMDQDGNSCCLEGMQFTESDKPYEISKPVAKKLEEWQPINEYSDDKPWDYQYICVSQDEKGDGRMHKPTQSNKPNTMFVFPNPSEGTFNVSINSTEEKIRQITIRDLSGRIVKTINVNDDKTSVSVTADDISSGFYFIEAKGKSQNWKAKIYIDK